MIDLVPMPKKRERWGVVGGSFSFCVFHFGGWHEGGHRCDPLPGAAGDPRGTACRPPAEARPRSSVVSSRAPSPRACRVAALSIGRGNAKTALSAGLALGALVGEWDHQPRREIPLAARTRDQARIAWDFAAGFARSLPPDVQAQLTFRRSPRLEIEYEGDGGGHVIRAIAADGKSALGMSPTFALLDERGHWAPDQGDALEHAILSALGKRGGRALIISHVSTRRRAPVLEMAG